MSELEDESESTDNEAIMKNKKTIEKIEPDKKKS